MPDGSSRRRQPPGGHVAGVLARTDLVVGVHKSPANAALTGALDVLTTIRPDQSASLVARGINFIATFKDRGVRLWGTRTLSSDPAWKYLSVRRLDLYIDRSIEAGLQWTVFEPNAAPLWQSVRASVEDFLLNLWRRGVLLGSTHDEAFFVKCDRTTMTTDDVLDGRLIVVVGVAHLRPAEFVIRKFRVPQIPVSAGRKTQRLVQAAITWRPKRRTSRSTVCRRTDAPSGTSARPRRTHRRRGTFQR